MCTDITVPFVVLIGRQVQSYKYNGQINRSEARTTYL